MSSNTLGRYFWIDNINWLNCFNKCSLIVRVVFINFVSLNIYIMDFFSHYWIIKYYFIKYHVGNTFYCKLFSFLSGFRKLKLGSLKCLLCAIIYVIYRQFLSFNIIHDDFLKFHSVCTFYLTLNYISNCDIFLLQMN